MSDVPFADVTAFTHRGRVRPANEDAIAVRRWIRSDPMPEPERWRVDLEEPLLCVVADGMGGHEAGEVASRLTAKGLSERASQLFAAMEQDPSTRGMGTTVAGIILVRGRLIWFNAGDSRIYRFRNGFLRQISVDDVPAVASTGAEGGMRRSHEIIQSLGGAPTFQPVDPHVGDDELAIPSRWLLCSDGLTDMVDLDSMEQCLASGDSEAVAALFERAMEAGGDDNVSIVIVSVANGSAACATEGR
jgi:serine/threonine protein phosphatase PrpC